VFGGDEDYFYVVEFCEEVAEGSDCTAGGEVADEGYC